METLEYTGVTMKSSQKMVCRLGRSFTHRKIKEGRVQE